MFPTVENRPGVFHLSALPRVICPDHLHSHIEIMMPIKGCLDAVVDGTSYTVGAGEILFCFPNQLHGYPAVTSAEGLMLIFSPTLLPEMGIDWENIRPQLPVILYPGRDALYARDQLLEHREATQADRRLQALLHLLVSGLLDATELEPADKPMVGDILYRALEYVSLHYTEKLSLQRVARSAGASEYHLSHLFNARLHMDFRQYVNQLRIDKACRLLAQKSLPVEEVAFSCGFSTLRTFDRVFQKIHNCTPRDYRKKLSAGNAQEDRPV